MDVLVDLAEVDATMVDRVGGKGLSLGLLTRAGFAVPDGFCVLDGGVPGGDRRRSPRRCARCWTRPTAGGSAENGRRLERYQLSAATAGGGTLLGDRRGSAQASFAGQQDTFLNVVGAAGVLDAVRRCWASLWTERAVAYRDNTRHRLRRRRTGGGIQRMVDADVAGVLFTADPVTGTPNHTVIDASPGLGEAVVSGAVNPDHFGRSRPPARCWSPPRGQAMSRSAVGRAAAPSAALSGEADAARA